MTGVRFSSMNVVLDDADLANVDLVEVEDEEESDDERYEEEQNEKEEENDEKEKGKQTKSRRKILGGFFDRKNEADDDDGGVELDQSLGGSLSGKKRVAGYTAERISFLDDDPKDMTYSRRIALKLMKHGWYNPRVSKQGVERSKFFEDLESELDDMSLKELPPHFRSEYGYPVTHSVIENPQLEKAWAYFEHNTLTRYIEIPKEASEKHFLLRCFRKIFCKAGKTFDKADPGENHLQTKLYHPIFTPHSQLGDFGLGVGLYFSNLRGLCVLTLLAGLFSMPIMRFYYGPEYSHFQPDVTAMLRGSAVCTEQEWVPCIGPDCNNATFPGKKIALGFMGNQTQMFAHKNLCNGALMRVGMVNLASVFFVIFGMVILNCYLQNMEVSYDEDEQTPQDYAVVISNPPEDATDPEEWRSFFKDKLDVRVTTLTLAVNNDLLVRSLVKRREFMKKIELASEPGTPLDMLTLCELAAVIEKSRNIFQAAWAKFSPGIPEFFGKVVVLTAKLQGLAQLHYPVTYVFCIFETEADKRKVLQKLSVGKHYSTNNVKSVLPEKYLFRGDRVLDIEEANEPDTIRWTDLNITFKESIIQKAITLVATFIAIVIGILLVWFVSDLPGPLGGTYGSAQCISLLNISFPMFAKWLTRKEAHESETSTQTSLYFKIALFRFVNTAVVISIITPFTATLDRSNGIIQQIYNLFYSEIITTTIIQIADGGGHFTRHFLAPRAKTQDAMNLCMKGQSVDIAERYTNMTKLFFLTVWYCSIYPAAFFMCSIALFINYFQDRFSLMRTWRRAPNLGNHISRFSRRYFLVLCIAAMIFMSSWFWSAFPYDNLCETGSVAGNYSGQSLVGTWRLDVHEDILKVKTGNASVFDTFSSSTVDTVRHVPVEVLPSNKTYKYCSQNLMSHNHPNGAYRHRLRFPFWASKQIKGFKWMTPKQEELTDLYGWHVIALQLLLVVYFCWKFFNEYRDRFRSTYTCQSKDQGINYSEVPSISAFIPQVKSRVYAFPLLAADCDHISKDLIEWTDPNRAHVFYDVTKDADALTTRKVKRGGRRSFVDFARSSGLFGRSTSLLEDDHLLKSRRRNMPELVYSQVAHWPPTNHANNR